MSRFQSIPFQPKENPNLTPLPPTPIQGAPGRFQHQGSDNRSETQTRIMKTVEKPQPEKPQIIVEHHHE